MPNLTHLELNLGEGGEEGAANPAFNAPLKSIVQRASNLQTLKLSQVSTSNIFDNANLRKLERLKLVDSYITDVLPLSRYLEHLTLSEVTIASKTLHALLTSGTLRQLKTIKLKYAEIGDVNAEIEEFWPKLIPEINLPALESLYFEQCVGFSANDALRISMATPQIPNCKEYTVKFAQMSDACNASRAKAFFASGLCSRLEELKLYNLNLAVAGFKALVENADKMHCLKRLAVEIKEKKHIQLIAESFNEAYNFRRLEELQLTITVGPRKNEAYWVKYCKEIFDKIHPTLKLKICSR